MKNKDIKNIIYNGINTCLSIIFPLITFPYISRVIGAVNVGKINFSNSIVSYFALIASLGIYTHAIRECSKVKDDYKKVSVVASQIYSINIISTIISLILLYATMLCCNPLKDYRLLIFIYSLNIIATTLGTDWINTAMENFRYITIRSFIFQLLSIVLMFVFVKIPSDYIIYSIIHIIASILICISNIIYRSRFCYIRFVFDFDIKQHIKPILLLFVISLSQNIFNNCDITMIGFQMGDYYVGLYTSAHKIINIIFMIVASICWVMIPQLTHLFANNDYDNANSLLHQITSFTVALGMPIVVGINVIPKEILLIACGNQFLDAEWCLRLLAISMSISFFIGIYGNMVLIPIGQDKIYMKSCIFAMIMNVIMNYFLIPIIGINGAAIATIISEFVNLVVIKISIDKRIRIIKDRKIFIAPIIGSLCIILIKRVIFMFDINIYLKTLMTIFISAFVYFVILILLKNEFAINFIYPVLKKIGIKIDE